jgi:hypothetical protein
MKTKIEVENRKEATLIKRGLLDPQTRALVKVMGALQPLSDRAKRRAMRFVDDYFDEERGNERD